MTTPKAFGYRWERGRPVRTAPQARMLERWISTSDYSQLFWID